MPDMTGVIEDLGRKHKELKHRYLLEALLMVPSDIPVDSHKDEEETTVDLSNVTESDTISSSSSTQLSPEATPTTAVVLTTTTESHIEPQLPSESIASTSVSYAVKQVSAATSFTQEQDALQREFIKAFLNNKVYIVTLFYYDFIQDYCIHRGVYGFVLVAHHRFSYETFLVKVLKKKDIPPALLVQTPDYPDWLVPLDLVTLQGRQRKNWPEYYRFYEATDEWYFVVRPRGLEKTAEEKKMLPGSKYHEVNWNSFFS
jgi:hypothetical protein